jgi:hypothetical protein
MPSPIEVNKITDAMPTAMPSKREEAAQPLCGDGAQGKVDGVCQ